MGLASLLLGEDNPFAQWVGQNQNVLGALGSGLGQGQNLQSGLAAGLAAAPQAKVLDRAAAEKLKAEELAENQANASTTWLRNNRPDLAQMVEAGMPISQAWNEAMRGAAPQTAEPFTLGPDQIRYAGDGSVLAQGPAAVPDPKDAFNNEKDLWGQYANADPVKTYEVVKGAYERVRQSAQLDTGAGDMGLIYGFMKLNDPGSVVRESEFAMAAQAGSFGEQIQGMVNRVLSGERLTPDVRRQFLEAADKLYAESSANLGDINTQFTTRAQAAGVDPARVVRAPEAFEPLQLGVPTVSTKYPNITITKIQ